MRFFSFISQSSEEILTHHTTISKRVKRSSPLAVNSLLFTAYNPLFLRYLGCLCVPPSSFSHTAKIEHLSSGLQPAEPFVLNQKDHEIRFFCRVFRWRQIKLVMSDQIRLHKQQF